jgi:hypothetical protein
MKKLLLFIFIVSIQSAISANLKMRAREHFELHEVNSKAGMEMFRGLTNTINLWWEEPYNYSFGLAFSPVIASIKEVEDDSSFGEKITQQNIGLEYKFFLSSIHKSLFSRLGIGYSKLEADSGPRDEYYGQFSYLGLGYEIPMNNFGLALEMAYRHADYNDDLYIKTITPSIGFHFYKDL